MPSHEPLGNSCARLLKKSRITAQAAALDVTGIVITLFCFFPSKLNSHCSFLLFSFFYFFQRRIVSYLCLFLLSALVFLVFGTTPTPHMQSITRGRRGRKYRKLEVKCVALLSSVSCMNTFPLFVPSQSLISLPYCSVVTAEMFSYTDAFIRTTITTGSQG